MWPKTNMDATNIQKLLNAGFTVIRTEEVNKINQPFSYVIKAKNKVRREWFFLQKDFKTKTALAAAVKELLTDAMTVEL